MADKPIFVQETEKYLGLTLEQDPHNENNWWVVTPSGVKMFYIFPENYDTQDIVGGFCSFNINDLQGIDATTRNKRRKQQEFK